METVGDEHEEADFEKQSVGAEAEAGNEVKHGGH